MVPDLLTMAKALAGGMPLAAVTGRAELMDASPPRRARWHLRGQSGGLCRGAGRHRRHAGRRTWPELPGASVRSSRPALEELQRSNPAIGDVRGRGAMMAMEIVRPGTLEPDPEATRRILAACHRAGVIVLSCGSFGNVMRLLPPLVIEPDLLAEGLACSEPPPATPSARWRGRRAQMAAALDGCVGAVTVDLGGVTFMDSSGLGTLIRARNRIGEDGGQLSVTGVSQNVRRLFEVTGLADFLTG